MDNPFEPDSLDKHFEPGFMDHHFESYYTVDVSHWNTQTEKYEYSKGGMIEKSFGTNTDDIIHRGIKIIANAGVSIDRIHITSWTGLIGMVPDSWDGIDYRESAAEWLKHKGKAL